MRYVDDVFAIFNSSTDVQLLVNVLNNQHPNLRFTCEEASGPSLPFLDVKITICNEEFNISVYRNQLLPVHSYISTAQHLYPGNGALLLSYYIVLI